MSGNERMTVTYSIEMVARAQEVDRAVRGWMTARMAKLAKASETTIVASPLVIAEAIRAADHEIEASLRRLTAQGWLTCWRRPEKRWITAGRYALGVPARTQVAPSKPEPEIVRSETQELAAAVLALEAV